MADFKVTELDSSVDFGNLKSWDVVIIGAGPAGLAAGLTTAHRGLTTLIVEAKDKPGGQPRSEERREGREWRARGAAAK